ncbi:sensor histidine kinase [Parvularcula maris]|uniref:histidine kinase n=1 Tax=Parvularcula maris TaxID=2965077 RepID=A0A9X2RL30_9PROT|nr:PAS domain-containing protein [Parvularcula maris]MCQ8186408.1 PAS domain-containing protein [Parvularcula maris]
MPTKAGTDVENLTLAAALAAAKGVGTFDWLVSEDVVRVDGRIAELYGLDPKRSGEDGLPVEDYLNCIHEDDRPRVEATLQSAVADVEDYQIEYRIVQPDGTDVWCRAQGQVMSNEDGGPAVRVVGVVIDIDDAKRTNLAVEIKEAQLEAVLEGAGLGSWTWSIETGQVRYNERWAGMLGYRLEELEQTFDQFERLLHPGDRERAKRALDAHLCGDAPTYSEEIRLRHKEGRWVWVKTTGAVTYRNDQGTPLVASGTHEDISLRREQEAALAQAKAQVELALREVNHRVQNLFALVPALVSLSANETDDAGELADKIRSRVGALARSHSLTLNAYNRDEGVDLESLVAAVLEPYAVSRAESGFAVQGPHVRLNEGEANAASLTLHELATNAAKHGALSVPEGRVSIDWEVLTGAADTPIMALRWLERAGPAVVGPPSRQGFGTRLIDSLIRSLRGEISRNWAEDGLTVDVRFPLIGAVGEVAAEGNGGL